MLKKLTISDYALIKEVSIDFSKGFTTVTGESGAGKSIMLESLGLLLGSRADFSSIRFGSDKCIVEATFSKVSDGAINVLKDNNLDVFDEQIIRRELTTSGRSRAFVNDTPVNVNLLKTLGRHLIDLHGQHENLALQSQQFKFLQLDSFVGHHSLVAEYKSCFSDLQKTEKRVAELTEAEAQIRKDQDYFQFQFDELRELNLGSANLADLESELGELENAEEIIQTLNSVNELLAGDTGLKDGLARGIQSISGISRYSTKLSELQDRLTSVKLELDDISNEVERSADSIEANPQRMEVVREQLDSLNRLYHKHNVSDLEALEQVAKEYELKLSSIDSFEKELAELNAVVLKLRSEATTLAKKLSANRSEAAKRLGSDIEMRLRELGMPKATFQIVLHTKEELSQNGLDEIDMRMDANGNSNLQSIESVASGGETARLMLALKSIVSDMEAGVTMIFDEIDTGVSGEVAKRIGHLMKSLSNGNQLLAVTHSPGVAAQGIEQLKIYKHEQGDQMISQIKKLTENERIEELASMFSGDSITDASRESARMLLSPN